jgi:PAS domain S-box-containing protein
MSESSIHDGSVVEAHVRQLLETLPGMIGVMSTDGKLEYVNRETLELLGVPFEEIAGTKWVNFLHPDDAQPAFQEWLRCRSTRQAFRSCYRVRSRDGAYRWCRVQAKPLLDELGRVAGFHCYLSDVDDLRRADESLRESERTLRLLIDSVPAFVWGFDASGSIEFLNRRAADHLGIVPGDTCSRLRARVHADDADMTARVWDLARAKAEPFSVTCRLRGSSGAYRWFEVRGEPISDANGRANHWYGFAVDIDDSVQVSEQLKASQAALEKASRMATLAELTASIAHEINQPLSSIATNGAACDRWLSATPPNMVRAKQTMERIVRDARNVSDVVERVRALYHYGPLSRAHMNVNCLLREARDLLLVELSRAQVTVDLDLASALPSVNADRIQIQQVLTNFIRNAIDAIEGDTRNSFRGITLITRAVDATCVSLAVRDTGPGFADHHRAFEAFYTTKERGMGMGLPICRTIAEAHGGSITVRNIQPHGACVELLLPVAAMEDAPSFAHRSPACADRA